MPVTVSDVAALPGLGLRVVAGTRGLSRLVRIVHTSEIDDPTPWLRGGELLLTTGMRIDDPAAFTGYVERLAAAKVAGIGFGTGVGYHEVPGQLVQAADRLGLPVLEVPYDAPYVAISEAVASRLAEEQRTIAERAYAAQQELAGRAAQAGPWNGIMPCLAKLLDCWCLVVGQDDTVLSAVPDVAAKRLGEVERELGHVRRLGPQAAGSAAGPARSLWIRPLAVGSEVYGHLITGKDQPFGAFDRMVLGFAVSLLSLELSRAQSVDEAERRFRSELAGMLLSGQIGSGTGQAAMRAWGLRPETLWVCACLAPPGRADALAQLIGEAGRLPGTVCAAVDERELTALAAGQEEAAALVEQAASAGLVTGVSAQASVARLPAAAREARLAAQVATAEGIGQAWFEELDTYRVLLGSQDPNVLSAFTNRVLGALDQHDRDARGELVRSLEAFLRHGGRWDPAAADLGVHRNTLRYRIRQVEQLTGRRLTAADASTEFWLALRLRHLLNPGDIPAAEPDAAYLGAGAGTSSRSAGPVAADSGRRSRRSSKRPTAT